MNDERKGPSKLSDLFEDLQDTLESSICSDSDAKPKKTAERPKEKPPEKPKPKEPEIFEAEPPKPEPPKPPPKKAQPHKPEPEQVEKGPSNVLWEVQKDDEYVTEQSDMDLELLKAIGIGRNENTGGGNPSGRYDVAPPGKAGGEVSGQGERAERPAIRKPPPKTFYRASEGEFTDRDQIGGIFESYRNECVSAIIRLAAGTALFLVLFYMEIAPYLRWKMPGILNIYYYNLPYIWIDMQILVLVAAINRKSLAYGLKSMFASNINVYSISVFFLVVSFVHTVLTINLRYNNPDMALYNSVAVYSMVMLSLYNLLDISAEIDSFKTVSSNKQKYALTLTDVTKTPKTSGPRGASGLYGSAKQDAELFRDVAAFGSNVGGVVKTSFIANFFARTYKNKHPGGLTKYFVYISVFAALAMFIVTMGVRQEKDWYVSLSSVATLMLGSIPMCSFIAGAYPAFKAQKKARQTGAAFVGGEMMDENSGTPVISVYDKDIFPAKQVRISGIRVSKNAKIETVMQNLCLILDKLNMPPAETFKASANFDATAKHSVKVIGADDDGVCFTIDGKKLFMGKGQYVSNLGLTLPAVSDVDEAFLKSLGCIMFLASESEVMAKVYIAYELTPDYYEVIKNIKKINACLCIRTFDPNIDEELVVALGGTKKYPVRVLKLKDTADNYEIPDSADVPVVSKESLKSLMGAVVIADKIKTLIKTNAFIQVFAFAAGLILSAILWIAGQFWGINAGHLVLFQSFWMILIVILLEFS